MKWLIIILLFASMMPGDVYIYSNGSLELLVPAYIYEDDFNGTSLAPDWKPVCYTSCTISVSNGRLYMSSTDGLAYIYVNKTYPEDLLTIESLMYFDIYQKVIIIVGFNGTHLLGVLVDEDNVVELVSIDNATGTLTVLYSISYVIIRYRWYNIRVDFNKTSNVIRVYANNTYVATFPVTGLYEFLAGIGTYYSYMTFENFTVRHTVRYVEIRNLPVNAYIGVYKQYAIQLYEGILANSTLRISLDNDPPVSIILLQVNSTKAFNITDVFGIEYDTTQVFGDGFFNITPTEYITGVSVVSVNSTNLTSALVYVAQGVLLDSLYLNDTPLPFTPTNYTVTINGTVYNVYSIAFQGYGVLKAILEIPNIFYNFTPTYDGVPLANTSRIVIGDKINLTLPVGSNITVTYGNVTTKYTNTSSIVVNCTKLGSLRIEAIYTNTNPVIVGYNVWKYNVTYGTITVNVEPVWLNGLSIIVNRTYTLGKTNNTLNVSSGEYYVEAFYRKLVMGYRSIIINTLNPDVTVTFRIGYLEDKDYRGEIRRFIWSEGLRVSIENVFRRYPYAKTRIVYELPDNVSRGVIFVEYSKPVDSINVEYNIGSAVDVADNMSVVTIYVTGNGSTLIDDLLKVDVNFFDVVYGRTIMSQAYFNGSLIQVSGLILPGKYRVSVDVPSGFKLAYIVVDNTTYNASEIVLDVRKPLILTAYYKLPVHVIVTGKTVDVWGNLMFYVSLRDYYGNPVVDKSVKITVTRDNKILKQVIAQTDRNGGVLVTIPNAKPGKYVVLVYSPEDEYYVKVSTTASIDVTEEELPSTSVYTIIGIAILAVSVITVTSIVARRLKRR